MDERKKNELDEIPVDKEEFKEFATEKGVVRVSVSDEKDEQSAIKKVNSYLRESESLSTPILANIYDQSNFKIAKLEDKNERLTAKNKNAQTKIDKAKNFVELFNQIKDPTIAKAVPAPVFKFMEKIAEQKQEKINNLSSKIEKRNDKIANNDKKIAKHTKTLETCKKVDTFLQNMKSPEGRKENFINGLQEFNNIALNKATSKLADVEDKITKASTAYEKTHSATDKLKLRNKINKLTEQKNVLESKIQGLGGITNRINAVQNAPQDKADEVISKSCEGIVNAVAENPEGFAKNQAERVVEVCNTVIDKELPNAELGLGQDKPDNYLKNAEMMIEDDYNSIDGVINNGSKEKEQEKLTEKSSEKEEKRGAFPVSRNKIKQNAEKIAKSEHKATDDKQKSKGQEL